MVKTSWVIVTFGDGDGDQARYPGTSTAIVLSRSLSSALFLWCSVNHGVSARTQRPPADQARPRGLPKSLRRLILPIPFASPSSSSTPGCAPVHRLRGNGPDWYGSCLSGELCVRHDAAAAWPLWLATPLACGFQPMKCTSETLPEGSINEKKAYVDINHNCNFTCYAI
jgi:hypothetical protein